MKAWCLFEQSGTFRDAFKKHGIQAQCVDIRNDYNQTDIILDLFSEIDKASMNLPSFFDNIAKDDIVFAFFPCVKFVEKHELDSRGGAPQFKNYTDLQKLAYSKKSVNELALFYDLWCKMFEIALNRGFKMIVENPHNVCGVNFLQRYFPIKPKITIYDRNAYGGDKFKKPTSFWFVNCEPQNNFIFETPNLDKKTQAIANTDKGKARSEISPSFADRFLREFVLTN